jgi:uncharacterized sulfatase
VTIGYNPKVDPSRDHVVTGRERHVAIAREGFLPYPQRCLRTADCPRRPGAVKRPQRFRCKSVLYGAFVWARRALNRQKRRFPARAVIYIVNFEPDRWPAGDPRGMDDPAAPAKGYDALETDTMAAYPDMDASPTKAWMVHHREDLDVEPLYGPGRPGAVKRP